MKSMGRFQPCHCLSRIRSVGARGSFELEQESLSIDDLSKIHRVDDENGIKYFGRYDSMSYLRKESNDELG